MTDLEETIRRIVREELRAALQNSGRVEVLSLRAAADYLDIAEKTLRDWRVDRKGPPAVKYGRLVKYRRQDLDQWIADQRR